MGMYTELILGCKIKGDAPKEVIDTLKWMCESKDRPVMEHDFPSCWPFPKDSRHKYLFWMGSYYFGVTNPHPPIFEYDDNGNAWQLSTRSNLKDYGNEIESFLTWLKPHIEKGSGTRDFYAIVCYEEQAEPTIYYLHEEEQ
jgi:hypothetical protein